MKVVEVPVKKPCNVPANVTFQGKPDDNPDSENVVVHVQSEGEKVYVDPAITAGDEVALQSNWEFDAVAVTVAELVVKEMELGTVTPDWDAPLKATPHVSPLGKSCSLNVVTHVHEENVYEVPCSTEAEAVHASPETDPDAV